MDPRLHEIPAYVYGTPSPLRRFNDLGIQAQIDRAVAQAGDFERAAAVVHYDIDGKTLTTSLVLKAGAHFTVAVAAYKAPNADWQGEAGVSWKF